MEVLDAPSWLSPLSIFCQPRVVETVPKHHGEKTDSRKISHEGNSGNNSAAIVK